jgi:hypothetical protein
MFPVPFRLSHAAFITVILLAGPAFAATAPRPAPLPVAAEAYGAARAPGATTLPATPEATSSPACRSVRVIMPGYGEPAAVPCRPPQSAAVRS